MNPTTNQTTEPEIQAIDDGEVVWQGPLSQILADNADCEDVCEALLAIKPGETVQFGGGASAEMSIRRLS